MREKNGERSYRMDDMRDEECEKIKDYIKEKKRKEEQGRMIGIF